MRDVPPWMAAEPCPGTTGPREDAGAVLQLVVSAWSQPGSGAPGQGAVPASGRVAAMMRLKGIGHGIDLGHGVDPLPGRSCRHSSRSAARSGHDRLPAASGRFPHCRRRGELGAAALVADPGLGRNLEAVVIALAAAGAGVAAETRSTIASSITSSEIAALIFWPVPASSSSRAAMGRRSGESRRGSRPGRCRLLRPCGPSGSPR